MSNPRSIHLFNCDRTYKFDAVEDWLNGTKPKLGFEFSVEKHYFSLSEMSELSSKKIPSLQMDLAVFVVHAHESRLSINEDSAGIGYAKIYRALLQATDGNVIIVIGGDDNYKNEDEEDKEFISRWAKRKVSSQFNEEFLDGKRSFIFSWNKKHREIHEEALVHFFDKSQKGQKFEYQRKRKLPSTPVTQPQTRAIESARRKPEETRTQPQPGTSGPLQCDDRTEERITRDRDKSSLYGEVAIENAPHYPKPQQSPRVAEPTRRNAEDTNTRVRSGTRDPLQYEDRYPNASCGKVTGESAPLYTRSADRSGQQEFERKKQKDLSVLGWEAKPESLSAVIQLIQKHRYRLQLASDPDVYNPAVHDMIPYLKQNPMKYCVLVVDAEKVKFARDVESKVDYLRLLQTAERNVEKKIIVIVCWPLFKSTDDEKAVKQTIENAFSDNKKVCVAWFKNGKPALGEDEFIKRLQAAIVGTPSHPLTQGHSTQYPQIPSFGTSAPDAQANAASGSSQQFCKQYFFTSDSQRALQPQGKTENPPSQPPIDPYNYKVVLPPGKTVMLMTRLRNGRISYLKEDVEYQKPGFVVQEYMKSHLLQEHSKTSDAKLVVLLNEKGQPICQVGKKKDKGWHEFIVLALDEIIMLQTRLKKGLVSFENKDVVVRYLNWQVPQDVVLNLKQTFPRLTAELFVISDLRANFRCIVQVGVVRHTCNFVPVFESGNISGYEGKGWQPVKFSE